MITIIHGENTAESRKYYLELKKKPQNQITFDGTAVTISDVTQAFEGQGLFENDRSILIEDFFSKRKSGKETDALISYLKTHEKDHSLILWESKILAPKQLNHFTNATVRKFDFPKVLFSFLDSITPGNGKHMLRLFHQTLETEETEFVFFMIVRHFRMLLALIEPGEEAIDEVRHLAPWQKGKLQKQMQLFGREKLIQLYQQLFSIEQGMKTGQLALSLVQTIDFLLINI